MSRGPDHRSEEEAEMDDQDPRVAPSKVTIRNATRSSLSFRVPGESIHLLPGQSVDVHKAYLETTELKTLCKDGAVTQIEPRPPAKAAAGEGDTDAAGEPTRRSGPRKR
jgi:hypothetical protein